MASKTLGRITCPIGCGHTAAQVKIKTDKGDDKTAYPYIHCAGCGIQLHTRNDEQARHLLKGARPEKGAQTDEKPSPAHEQAPEGTQTPPPPQKAPSGLSGWLLGGGA